VLNGKGDDGPPTEVFSRQNGFGHLADAPEVSGDRAVVAGAHRAAEPEPELEPVQDVAETPGHRRQCGSWIPIAAGVVTIVLVLCAIVDVGVLLYRQANPAATTTTQPSPPQAPVAAPPPAVPPAAPGPEHSAVSTVDSAAGLAAVIATPCKPNSSNGLTVDGSVAYCEPLESTDTYLWSLFPGTIPTPSTPGDSQGEQADPAIAVCMTQTGRSQSDCAEYVSRPGNPGDGQPGT
jgi:hypothetical protein